MQAIKPTPPSNIHFSSKKDKVFFHQSSYNQPVNATVQVFAKTQKSDYAHSHKSFVAKQKAGRSQSFFKSSVQPKPLIKPAISYLGDVLSRGKRKAQIAEARPLYLQASNDKANGRQGRRLSHVTAVSNINETLFLTQFLVRAISGNKLKPMVVNQKMQKTIKKVENLQDTLKGKTLHLH